MAQYEEHNKLDYRQGGDTVDDFARKHMSETTRIFQFLNDLRSLKTNNIEYTEPEPNQLKAEDSKLYIRNATNDAWILLGEIAPNFGFKPADADFISSEELSHEKIAEVNAFDHDKAITIDDITKAKIADVNNADLRNMLVKQDISIPAEGLVTNEPQKLVQTNNDGVLPVNILGNAAKLAGIRVDSDIIQDGQVLTYRAATNTWHNENKGVIGSGKALNLYDGEELLCSYVGDETRDFDLGITANKKYVEDLVDSKANKTDVANDIAAAVTEAKEYTDTEKANYLPLSGGALTGDIGFSGTTRTISHSGDDLIYGDKAIKSMAFPSATSVNCNITASDQTYTAPANGFVRMLITISNGIKGTAQINATNGATYEGTTGGTQVLSAMVKKGDSATIRYNGCTFNSCLFYYAEGEV